MLYRKNVVGILQDAEGRILIGERLENQGSWQFPQGGIDDGESALDALHRELEEELGVHPPCYRVQCHREGYRYEFEGGRLKFGIFGGQEQIYFLCRFTGNDSDIQIETAHQEFRAVRWIRPGEFKLDWVPEFKKNVYRRVFLDFFAVEL